MRTSWHLAAVSLTSVREQLAAGDAIVIAFRILRRELTHTATDHPRNCAEHLRLTSDMREDLWCEDLLAVRRDLLAGVGLSLFK